ncbi:hypothetical protein ACFVT5_40560 [Streptomyces sp. NPDC058001]|uniref:hypothetical protein n=1 Tax=Streptomyces sp. NPDC058001 TaxID=3346300 RepID=UPI0036EE8FFA
MIGATCAEVLSAAGAAVTVLDRGTAACGNTATGAGNVLLSDKAPGPELELARAPRRRWPELLASLRDELGPRSRRRSGSPRGASPWLPP